MWFGLGVMLKKKIIISHGISRELTLEIQNVKGLSTITIQKKNPSSCSYGNNGGNIEYIPKEKKSMKFIIKQFRILVTNFYHYCTYFIAPVLLDPKSTS